MWYYGVASGPLRYSQRAERSHMIFFRDRSGNVAMVFALMAVVLMLAVGAAVDFGRGCMRGIDDRCGDGALLASGRWLETNSTDNAGAIAAAQNVYTQNTASGLPDHK